MFDMERIAGFAPVAELGRRRMLRVGAANFLAAGILVGASIADARTTRIQILSRTTAFGGYSFPGIGQYEVITGIATGEVNPNDPNNAVITDISRAPRLPNGNVGYQHNFYILKPVDLSKGNHKMMYEPPNRGPNKPGRPSSGNMGTPSMCVYSRHPPRHARGAQSASRKPDNHTLSPPHRHRATALQRCVA